MIKTYFYNPDGFFIKVDWVAEGFSLPNTTHIPIPTNTLPADKQWRFVAGVWVQATRFSSEVVINHGTKITKLAFLNRLGDTVLGTIEAASRVNNPLGYAAAVIKVKHASSTYIDLSLQETQDDIQKLVDYGFIDEIKRLTIINTPVTEKEVPLFLSGNIY
jgi:hypothetical protein